MEQDQIQQLLMVPLPPAIGALVLGGLVFLLLIFLLDEAFKDHK
jgi:hypothetical protein